MNFISSRQMPGYAHGNDRCPAAVRGNSQRKMNQQQLNLKPGLSLGLIAAEISVL